MIQIWPFDPNNRIDMVWEFNYVIGFFIRTGLTFFYQIFSTSDIPKDCAVPSRYFPSCSHSKALR